MNKRCSILKGATAVGCLAASSLALAFNSGSTGADGAFNPTVSQAVQLPPTGTFNFTSVNIPSGVTITFKKNVTNTPVVILASGDVTIAGVLSVSGSAATGVGASGGGAIGDDGTPGAGGPGGYGGGVGGGAPQQSGGAGLGPGAGSAGLYPTTSPWGNRVGGGGGGGFGTAGTGCYYVSWNPVCTGGPVYGSSLLLPLVGGSGGGGGAGGSTYGGSGGGGGGGAILIAASGTVSVTGSLLANGAGSGAASGGGTGATGGGGSGGAIRIVATTLTGNGTVSAVGAAAGVNADDGAFNGGAGGTGRIRFEAENITRTVASSPAASVGPPGSIFVAGLPSLTISSVAGVAAPAAPTGTADITLPSSTTNPVTIVVTTTGVPVGNTVKITVTPAAGSPVSAVSGALTGSSDSATASASVTLPTGPSTLQATVSYTVVASVGDAMSVYAQGERVEQVRLSAVMGGASVATLITVSGKEFQVPASVLTAAAAG